MLKNLTIISLAFMLVFALPMSAVRANEDGTTHSHTTGTAASMLALAGSNDPAQLESIIKLLKQLIVLLMEQKKLVGDTQSHDGENGHHGEDGEDGKDGKDGEDGEDGEDGDSNELEIEVEFEDGDAKVMIEYEDGEEDTFTLKNTDESDKDDIIDEIVAKTDLTKDEVKDVIEYENEDDDEDDEEDD